MDPPNMKHEVKIEQDRPVSITNKYEGNTAGAIAERIEYRIPSLPAFSLIAPNKMKMVYAQMMPVPAAAFR